MSDNNNSVINFGDVAKPADTLIKKISGAVGGYFKPYQIRRIAEADADAAMIKAQSEIQITDLHRRAMNRFIHEEATKQENIESITNAALPQLNSGSSPEKIEDDWITNFFDKCRIVSDVEMQALWAKILAGEVNAPGTYSKRTVNFLGTLDKYDADCFMKVMQFRWNLNEVDILIYNLNDPMYKQNGLNFSILSHLDNIGLITYETLSGFRRMGFGKKTYFEGPSGVVVLEFKNEKDNELKTGKAMLTKLGRQLANVSQVPIAQNFDAYVCTQWASQGITSFTRYGKK